LLLATFFGCGKSRFAPGTVGSLASLLIWVPVSLYCPLYARLSLLVLLFFLGVWVCGYAIAHYQKIDPPQVVIDEVVGQGIPFLFIKVSWLPVLLAFLLFRFFDIVKPWPIKWSENYFPNKWGIMIDDVIAGFMASAVLLLSKKWFM
jgi:phosphatidylglycerophosphatase A